MRDTSDTPTDTFQTPDAYEGVTAINAIPLATMTSDSHGAARGRNLNTILLTATLGTLSFISWLSVNNSMQLARLEGTMVGRQEIEAKIAEVKAAQSILDKDLTALKLALAERGLVNGRK